MAKCKDCLHYEACSAFSKIINAACDVEQGCEYFKDRTNYQEVVHGRWIEGRKCRYICSVCQGEAGLYGGGIGQNLSNYCPNCGAKMDGGDGDG